MLLYHLFCAFSALLNQRHNLGIYLRPHLLRVRPQVLSIPKPNIPNAIIHPQFGHDIESDSVGFIQVVCGPISTGAIEMLLSTSSSKYKAYLIDELVLGAELILIAKVLREPKGPLGSRNDS